MAAVYLCVSLHLPSFFTSADQRTVIRVPGVTYQWQQCTYAYLSTLAIVYHSADQRTVICVLGLPDQGPAAPGQRCHVLQRQAHHQ